MSQLFRAFEPLFDLPFDLPLDWHTHRVTLNIWTWKTHSEPRNEFVPSIASCDWKCLKFRISCRIYIVKNRSVQVLECQLMTWCSLCHWLDICLQLQPSKKWIVITSWRVCLMWVFWYPCARACVFLKLLKGSWKDYWQPRFPTFLNWTFLGYILFLKICFADLDHLARFLGDRGRGGSPWKEVLGNRICVKYSFMVLARCFNRAFLRQTNVGTQVFAEVMDECSRRGGYASKKPKIQCKETIIQSRTTLHHTSVFFLWIKTQWSWW